MDAISIKTFIAVTESGSFSKAAELLFLTQPAISKRIASLEQELECRLFDRIGRKILLTEAGKALYPRARRILREMDDSRRAILNLAGNVSGQLALATSHHIGLHRLPPVLRYFNKTYPDVELDLRFLDSETACRSVVQGELELAIITLPTIAEQKLLLTQIWKDPLSVVIGMDHPLAGNKGAIPPALLARYPAILPGPQTFTREIIESEFNKHGVSLSVRLSTNYLETIKMLVTVGMGWSILPASMIADGELISLPVADMQPQRFLGIVRHGERTLSNAARALIDFMESDAADAVS